MARLAVITDEISSDLDHALDVCDELGISTVELRVIGGANIVDLDNETIDSVKASLDRHGCSVACIASPFLKCDFWGEDEAAHDAQIGILRRSIEIADALDAPIVRITTPHIPLPSASALEDIAIPTVERIVATVKRRLDEAR